MWLMSSLPFPCAPGPVRVGQALLLAALAGLLLTGCSGTKPNGKDKVLERGWVGGEYKLAHVPRCFGAHATVNAFPPGLSHLQKAGVLVLRVATNAPAQAAGLCEGDVILEVRHQPVTGLRRFRRLIEESQLGTWVPFRIWRDGEFQEKRICVGREKYRRQGAIALGLITHNFNFGTAPGFSLLVAGYLPNAGQRIDLNSVEHQFVRKCGSGDYQPPERDWAAWLAVIEVSNGKIILSQEPASTGAQL